MLKKAMFLPVEHSFMFVSHEANSDVYTFSRFCECVVLTHLIGGKKTGHKINRVKLLVGGNFSHFHIKLVTFPQLNFRFSVNKKRMNYPYYWLYSVIKRISISFSSLRIGMLLRPWFSFSSSELLSSLPSCFLSSFSESL